MMQSPPVTHERAAPVSAPQSTTPVPRVFVTLNGQKLVAGLTWQVAPQIDFSALADRTGLRLRHGSRAARLAGLPGAEGAAPLLLALGNGFGKGPVTGEAPLPEGTWLFCAEPGGGMYWFALAEMTQEGGDKDTRTHIEPRSGPEYLCAGRQAWRDALGALANVTSLAGVAVAGSPVDGTLTWPPADMLADLQETLGIEPRRVRPASENIPVFTRPRALPIKTIAIGSLATAGIVTLALTVPPLVAAALRPAPTPPPEMVTVAIEPGAFAQACTETLAGWWPRITGWQGSGAGCALASDLPAELVSILTLPATDPSERQIVVWTGFKAGVGRNRVLARSAAEQVLENWPHGKTLAANRLTLWQHRALPVAPVEPGTAPVSPQADIIARLSDLWANAPEAVSVHKESFVITAPGPAAELLGSAAHAPGLEPTRIDLPATGPAELILRPRDMRAVPADLLGTEPDPPAKGETPP